jgi:hypothetical protein
MTELRFQFIFDLLVVSVLLWVTSHSYTARGRCTCQFVQRSWQQHWPLGACKLVNVMDDSPNRQPGVLFDIQLSTPEARVQAYLDAYKRAAIDNTTQDVACFPEAKYPCKALTNLQTFDGPLLRTHITLLSAIATSPTHAVVTFVRLQR